VVCFRAAPVWKLSAASSAQSGAGLLRRGSKRPEGRLVGEVADRGASGDAHPLELLVDVGAGVRLYRTRCRQPLPVIAGARAVTSTTTSAIVPVAFVKRGNRIIHGLSRLSQWLLKLQPFAHILRAGGGTVSPEPLLWLRAIDAAVE
jgi:hypothetical protein